MLKPRKLRPGDRLAAVSLSWGGAGAFPHRYEAGKRQLQEEFGVEVVETEHALADPAWLWRHPEARARDLMEAFADPSVSGIVSTIGGDDSIRMLPYLDLDVIRANPKVFLGYSDTTVTHFACLKAGLVSFYGPSIMAGFAESGGMFPYMVESVWGTLFSSEPIGVVEPNQCGWTAEFVHWGNAENQAKGRTLHPSEPWRFLQGEGIAEGPLIGGNLEVLDFLRGTDLWPNLDRWRGAILFIETSEEAPPPIALARTLRVYGVLGILQVLSGILVGRPGGNTPVEKFEEYDTRVLRVVAEEARLSDLPIVSRMDFGHTDPMFAIPYGITARIDCDRRQFSIVESAVVD